MKIPEGIVRLHLEKKIPTKYDDRMGIRGLTPDDTKDASIIHLMSLEDPLPEGRTRVFQVTPEEIWNTKDTAKVNYYISKVDNHNHTFEHPVLINSELIHDSLGRFRYTSVTVFYEEGDAVRKAVDAVNRLIDHYRIFSFHYWVHRITPDHIKVYYSQHDRPRSYAPTIKMQPDVSDDTLQSIRRGIKSDEVIPAFAILRQDAKNALELEDYRLAIVLSVMTIESVTKTFLAISSRDIELSNKCEKRLFEKISLHRLVTRVLPCFLPESELTREILEIFCRVNKKRNDIIHSSYSPTPEEGKEAVDLCDDLVQILVLGLRSIR